MAELLGKSRRAALPHAGDTLNEVVWTEAALANLRAIRAFIIRYRFAGDTVVILRIRHTSRRPTNP